MRSIGEMARESGLGVSALRFYDRAGVLVPAWVDPVSGYRWYEPEQLEEARVLARLRRAGMPLADIRLVLASWSGADTDLVRKLLTAHLRRLEQGLSAARDEFSALRALLDHRENIMPSLRTGSVRLFIDAPELAAALDAVRFAASTDPELPMLGGVLFDIDGESLHVVELAHGHRQHLRLEPGADRRWRWRRPGRRDRRRAERHGDNDGDRQHIRRQYRRRTEQW